MNVYFGISFNEPNIFSSNQHRERGNRGKEYKLKREKWEREKEILFYDYICEKAASQGISK